MNTDSIEAGLGVDLNANVDESKNTTSEINGQNLIAQIGEAVKGLTYTSETDAEIVPFAGSKADAVTTENVLTQTKNEPDSKIKTSDFTKFFDQLTALQDWFGDEEKAIAAKFSALRDLLKENLKDLKVFKIGKTDIDIYVVGLDSESNLTGIQTKAVET